MSHPQNPYESYIVRASAGSGKTYQLSRRFINLVGAGADSGQILTITFTKKAAAEMRERILKEASNLLVDRKRIEEFENDLGEFYQSLSSQQKKAIAKPLSAEQTAKQILGATQGLKITTIDSIFMDWVRKFPFESSFNMDIPLPRNFDVAEEMDRRKFDDQAWADLCYQIYGEANGLSPKLGELTTFDIKGRLTTLLKTKSFLWLVDQINRQQGRSSAAYVRHQTAQDLPLENDQDFLKYVDSELRDCIQELTGAKQEKAQIALTDADIDSLIDLKILKKDWTISGTSFRGKKKEKLSPQIAQIDEIALQFWNHKKISLLNEKGEELFKLFESYNLFRDKKKFNKDMVEFEDLARGCFQLFNSPDGYGARYLINQRTDHLLLDEFQDTSMLQWSIFETIANEFFSGDGLEKASNLDPTIFIVGDEKQSIYGFREADPRVLKYAAEELKPRGVKTLSLNHSYRSSPVILNFVNEVFKSNMADFPEHQPALVGNDQSLIPSSGSVTVAELFDKSDAENKLQQPAVEREALFVAEYLKEAIHGEQPLQIFDSSLGGYRKLEAKDCVVLYRTGTHAQRFEKTLQQLGFETAREESQGFFDRQEVRDFLAILAQFAYPHDILSFVHLIKSPFCPVSDKDLIDALEKTNENGNPVDRIQSMIIELSSQHPDFFGIYEQLRIQSTLIAPYNLSREIVDKLRIFSFYEELYTDSEAKLAIANIKKLIEIIHECQQSGHRVLPALLQSLNEKARIDDIASARVSGNAVTLMTIHKAKGLEFPMVALVGCGEPWEKKDSYWLKSTHPGKEAGVYFVGNKSDQPEGDPGFDAIDKAVSDDARLENLRLLYVALTRSKYHLLISGSQTKSSSKETQVDFLRVITTAIAEKEFQKTTLLGHDCLQFKAPLDPRFAEEAPIKIQQEDCLDRSSILSFLGDISHQNAVDRKTLAPARLLSRHERVTAAQSRFHPFEREVGIFIHAYIESLLKAEEFDSESRWKQLYSSGSPTEFSGLLDPLKKECLKLKDSNFLNLLLRGTHEIESEVEVAYSKEPFFVRGVIDLLIVSEDHSRVTIVDHKTTEDVLHCPDLEKLVQENQYYEQLEHYRLAIRSIYPEASINGAIWFTAIDKIHYLFTDFDDEFTNLEKCAT